MNCAREEMLKLDEDVRGNNETIRTSWELLRIRIQRPDVHVFERSIGREVSGSIFGTLVTSMTGAQKGRGVRTSSTTILTRRAATTSRPGTVRGFASDERGGFGN